jgi:hypothetical protein
LLLLFVKKLMRRVVALGGVEGMGRHFTSHDDCEVAHCY